jgi:hypothetical protein
MILAYIDPGLGSLIWQATVAFFVGLMFHLKKIRRMILDFCLKMIRRKPQAPVNTIPIPTRIPTKVTEIAVKDQ